MVATVAEFGQGWGSPGGTVPTQSPALYADAVKRYLSIMQQAYPDYTRNVGLFEPGGEVQKAQELQIEAEGKKAIAGATSDAIASGMSSGSMAAGSKIRAMTDVGLAKAKATEGRYGALSNALLARGGAMERTAGGLEPYYQTYQGV